MHSPGRERADEPHTPGGGLRVLYEVMLAPGATAVDVERDQEVIVE
ncbi:hypothetical protein [Streptomyces incanus]|uniref:Uncharacterized protein n=1 Tax=Streptomyces incanus TaxID=887453 RepID=A0ABW0Y2G2_9ACTN